MGVYIYFTFLYTFGLQFTCKQLERLAKKAEKESEKEQAKVKKVSKSLGELVQLHCLPTIFFHEELLWKDVSLLSSSSSPFHRYCDLSDKSMKPEINLKRSSVLWCKCMIEVKYE